ncbi:breast cancer type 2 susceptibility [Pelobates cultripes]|uniref:Breast cancer type 2 susceptibility n=1 Tax=Pelobates cultripes TaxID=61616 RepID=A0AAD1VRM6_PELCU|nr:breast cancer type 2 susceptibility [Pelobates cultripes]
MAQVDRPFFFELFKEHCSDSDLGAISLNWFQELTGEAAPYVLSAREGNEGKSDGLDENTVKTPVRKVCTFSQLDATPILFKEEVLSSPLFLSPTEESCRTLSVAENNNTDMPRRSPSFQTQNLLNKYPSPSSRFLHESPAVLKELFKTPLRDTKFVKKTQQKDGKPDFYESLLCTPKLMKSHSVCISESLGAEVDPEMSWSSSLATPPSPTVIITKDNEEVTRSKMYDSKTAVIVQSLFSKRDNGIEKKLLPALCETQDEKDPSHIAINGSLKVMCSTFKKQSDSTETLSSVQKVPWKQTVANTMKDKEVCQTVENVLEGMEDVLSIFFTNERNDSVRKMRSDRIRRKTCAKKEFAIPQNSSTQKENILSNLENHVDLDKDTHASNLQQDHKNDVCCKTLTNLHKETLSVYEWSQLNLCELNASQLENFPLPTDNLTNSIVTKFQGLPQGQERKDCNDLKKFQDLTETVNTSVCRSSRIVSDILTVEYTNTLSGKKVTVTKNYVNLLNQSSTLQHHKPELKLGEVIHENDGGSGTPFTLSSINQTRVAQSTSMERSISGHWEEGPCVIAPETNPNGVFSALKRQTKFLYCVTGAHGQSVRRNKNDVPLLSSNNHSCANEELHSQSKELELQNKNGECDHKQDKSLNEDRNLRNDPESLQENERNLPSMKGMNGESYISDSSYRVQANHNDFETRDPSSSNIRKKVLATAELLAEKHLLAETLHRQRGIQGPEENKVILPSDGIQNNSILTCRQSQQDKVPSNGLCNVICSEVHNASTEKVSASLHFPSLPSERTISSNLQRQVLPHRENEDINMFPSAVLESKSTSTDNSGNKCVLDCSFKNSSLNVLKPNCPVDEFQNATHKHNNVQICTSEDSNQNRNISVLLPSDTSCEHSISVNEVQTAMQTSSAFNKVPSLSTSTDSLKKEFEGFKTASNRKIHISEKNLMKAETLFKEIEALCLVTDIPHKTERKTGSLEMKTSLDVPASVVNLKGFKTASDKEIKLSDSLFCKGRLLFSDIEDESSVTPGRIKGGKINPFDLFSKPALNISLNTSKATSCINTHDSTCSKNISSEKMKLQQNAERTEDKTVSAFGSSKPYPFISIKSDENMVEHEKLHCSQPVQKARKSLFLNPDLSRGEGTSKLTKNSPARIHDVLTESQKAEVSELSSILERADSQYEFTQFKKIKPVKTNLENRSSLNDSIGTSPNLNNSDVWKDVDFNDSFAAGEDNVDPGAGIRSSLDVASHDKNFFDKSNLQPLGPKLLFKQKEASCGGFSLASGKAINVDNEALLKAAKMFSDFESTDLCHPTVHVSSVSMDLPDVSTVHLASEVNGSDMEIVPNFSATTELDTDGLQANVSVANSVHISNSSGEKRIQSTNIKAEKCVNVTLNPTKFDGESPIRNETCEKDKKLQSLDVGHDRGFQTASGKNIKFSQSSLEKVKHLFADDNSDTFEVLKSKDKSVQEMHVGAKPFPIAKEHGNCLAIARGSKDFITGFCTAGGKKVSISEESLAKVRNLFENENQLGDENKTSKQCDSQEVQTKDLKVKTCGPLGKETIESDEKNVSEILDLEDVPGRGHLKSRDKNAEGFQNVKILLFTENGTKNNLTPKSSTVFPIGFTTGKGKGININKASLLKVRNMFSDISDEAEMAKDNVSSIDLTLNHESNLVIPSGETLMKKKDLGLQKINSANTNEGVAQSSKAPSLPFSTGSGKTMSVSHDSYQKAKLMFSDINDPFLPDNKSNVKPRLANINNHEAEVVLSAVSDQSTQSNLYHNFQNKDFKNASSAADNVPMATAVSFSTASGRSVQLSEDSLRKAREMFNEIDDIPAARQQQKENLIHGNDIESITKKERQNYIQGQLATEEEVQVSKDKASINVNTFKSSFGFNTASGKKVLISDSAVQKVKGMLQEFDDLEHSMVTETLIQKHAPTREKVSTALLSNHEETEVLDNNLNHCQNEKPNLMHGESANRKFYGSETSVRRFPLSSFERHSTPSHTTKAFARFNSIPKPDLYFSASNTPENDFELEAAESAKAFMDDDDLMDAGPKGDVFANSNKAALVRCGKRLRSEDGMQHGRGEPLIKRQLLPEFDRATENQPKLQPLTSSPNGTMKDRRKCLYDITLQPATCNPTSVLKGRQENLVPKFTEPSQFHSKSNILFQRSHFKSAVGSSECTSQSNSSLTDNVPKRAVNTFVPPFKKQKPSSEAQSSYSQRNDPHRVTRSMSDRQEHDFKPNSALTEDQDNESDLLHLVSNLCCARDMQEMRIRKKQRQKIKPQPGLLYLEKTSSSARIPLLSAVNKTPPATYSKEQLYMLGVVKTSIGIKSENSGSFQFNCLDYYTKDCLLSENGVQIADGGWLIFTDNLKAGKEEFYRALCDTPGVDPKLISPDWVYNHYRWIVWKLASLEVKFPECFASRCLTPERVLLQLKYRYDVEIDQTRRSAIRKIMERDDSSAKTLVLCISRVITQGGNATNPRSDKNEPADTKPGAAVIEVTDGWYGIKALLDPALTALLHSGKLFIGQKIITHGAELVGCDDACTPLEAPESIMLKLSANSTRPAAWFTKLGYFRDPRPFCLPLSSLFSEGGIVGCVDVVIQRIYPIQYMEKTANGLYVFRNERAEEKEAEKHSANQQKNLEILFGKIQAEFEQQEASGTRRNGLRRRSLNRQQISALQDGAEIYEAIQAESDPGYLESCLSGEQLRALNHHRQALNDKKQAQIQAEFRKAIESSEQGPNGCAKRDVTPVLKMRLVDYKDQSRDTAYILNIWRPLPDVVTLLKEGVRFKMYNLATSHSKGKSEAADVQLTMTKKTQFQLLQSSQDIMVHLYSPREVIRLNRFLDPSFRAPYGEVDLVGLVISTCKKTGAAPIVYLSDETHTLLAVKFWTDLGTLALEEITKPNSVIAASNLRWRSECISGVPTLYAGDLSTISSNPKESHLQKSFQNLKQSIQCLERFHNEAVLKLLKLLQVSNLQDKRSLIDYTKEPRTPTWKEITAANQCLTPINNKGKKLMDYVPTPDVKPPLTACRLETDPKACKQLRGLDFLSRVPSPPPVTPIRSLVSPRLQRAFRPPRSSSAQKESTQVTGHNENRSKSTPRDIKSSTDTEGFIADEELALIDTQALVSGIGDEKADTRLSASENGHKPGQDSPTHTSQAETADMLQSVSPEMNNLSQTVEKDALLLGKKKLQRKRKRRL